MPAAAATLLVAALAGCGHGSASGAGSSTGTHSSTGRNSASGSGGLAAPSSPLPTGTRASALSLARKVPYCTGPRAVAGAAALSLAPALAPHRAAVTAAASAATCALRGHSVVIFAFASGAAQRANQTALAAAYLFYATGSGWTACPASVPEPSAQQSAVQDVALALGGLVEQGHATP